MLAHHVLFWLKADTSAEQINDFKDGLQSLEKITEIASIHIGTPAPIQRAVVDTSYTFSLSLLFKDLAAHDVYQIHEIHKAFLDKFRILFDKVIIYDAVD